MISFLRRSSTTIGLDIGSSFVKAAVVDHSGPEPELTHVTYLPLVADTIVEGEIMDPALLAETVRAIVEGLSVPLRNVVIAVGGRDVMIKKILMDRMAADDAREMIPWEAEQYVPFDMSNVQLDFQILDPDEDGLQMNVLLVAAKRDLVDQRMILLGDAGVAPSIVDIDAFALHNAFAYNHPDALRGVTALANIGHEITTILIQQDGSPLTNRDLPFGSRHLREELRRAHGLTAEEADAVLEGRSERTAEFTSFLAERTEELALAIERAAAFRATDDAYDRGVGAIYLCGGGARIPRLADTLAARLHTRVETANPIQRLRVHPDASVQFPAEELAPMLMLCIGLALRKAA
ncbi:MAG TPA: type IV pilus assembly protein PilM [Longimicrobiaceae bacterium]|nr:type IV pilus assembly protein PilM [Longimicrobiaceae bacterium]